MLVRVHDTRIHCDYSKNHLLREYSIRECPYDQLKVTLPVISITCETSVRNAEKLAHRSSLIGRPTLIH